MRAFIRLLGIMIFTAPLLAQATVVWSPCQTVAGVTNQPVGSNFLLTLSPEISGRSSQGIAGAVTFEAGQAGLGTDLSGLLASSLMAISLDRQVQISYDNSSSTCWATGVSIGGTLGSARGANAQPRKRSHSAPSRLTRLPTRELGKHETTRQQYLNSVNSGFNHARSMDV